jgi:proline iminopeptidase
MTNARPRFAIDETMQLNVNGARQCLRLRAERPGLPPLLIVQGGPGLPILHEVRKFERLLNLEEQFLVVYWEQRGCGNASARDAESVSMAQQVDDLRIVLKAIHDQTRQRVLILGISIGATFALQAVEGQGEATRGVVAISADAHTGLSDAASYRFLEDRAQCDGGELASKVKKLGPPPYLDPAALRRRATLLADLGTIEQGRTFGALLREMLLAMLRTYGVIGTVRALRNINLIQRKLLPEVAALDLLGHPPRLAVPVHYVFGENDALTPAKLASQLPAAVAAPATTAVRVPNAGHMVHFDHPDIVRSTLESLNRATSR